MAATESKMIPLGTKAPFFKLKDVLSDRLLSLYELKSDIATVIMFICNHCPFVKHINKKLVEISNYYLEKGVSFLGINSNDIINYPEDSPENMIIQAKELGYKFPYLFDENQDVAQDYDAACTPDFYIFDKDLKLVYHGQFDDSRPGNNISVTGNDLSNALEAILNNQPVNQDQKPSIGCSIKWKNNY